MFGPINPALPGIFAASKYGTKSSYTYSYSACGLQPGNIHIVPTTKVNGDSVSITFGAGSSGADYADEKAEAGIYVQYSDVYGTKMYFGTTSSYAGGVTAKTCIDNAGNFGIGNMSPSYKLDVNGAIRPLSTSGIIGTTTNDSVAAGGVGEYVTANLLAVSATSLTTNQAKTITSISLTAGDWAVQGAIAYLPTSTTNITAYASAISTTNNALPATNTDDTQPINRFNQAASVPGANASVFVIPPGRQLLSGTTTIYLVAAATFTASTLTAYGWISANRRR